MHDSVQVGVLTSAYRDKKVVGDNDFSCEEAGDRTYKYVIDEI
jgi:hypothetical protein